MTIVAELKALIEARGGDASGVNTIAEAVKVLTSLETNSNTGNEEELDQNA
ncbi:MAG: hypothetical protein ILA11_11265 [Butyrivibrio sp.]|nr:hypothetical protein [Butyrivibrio sp.]